MNKLEKTIFWGGLIVIIIDNIYWQWWIKLTVAHPIFSGDIFKGTSMAGDIVILAVWVYVLIRIYKKANRKEQEKD